MSEEYVVRGQFVTADKVELAKELRRHMTGPEALVWHRLRRNGLGLHFRRQQIIDGFVVDFYCLAARLVVEVDGPVHKRQRQADEARDETLAERGLLVLRITNEQVIDDIDSVCSRIRAVAVERLRP